MAERGRFTIANFHLDRGPSATVDTAAKLYGKTEIPAYGVLEVDDLTIFIHTAGQAEGIYAELGKIVTHLHAAELAAAWPEDLRGCTVRRAGVAQTEEQPDRLTGIILDRAGTLGELYAWVLWGNPTGAPMRERLEDLELISPPASAEQAEQ